MKTNGILGIVLEYNKIGDNMMKYTILMVMFAISACGRNNGILSLKSGTNGTNGHSAAFSQVVADTSVCSNGGFVLSSGVDTNDDAVLQPDETKAVTVTCNGLNGSNGANGTNGTNASPVTIVNLCPGVNSYPGVFIEVAFCINSELYGVYSSNGGFMTKLSDGNYSSNAIGSSCSLTINGCSVTH